GSGPITRRSRAPADDRVLTASRRAGGVLAFDPGEAWTDFVTPVTRHERLWEGAQDVRLDGVPVSELDAWLERRRGRPFACLGAPLGQVDSDPELEGRLRDVLNAIRRPKDAVELERMRAAERATAAGFAAIAQLLEAGRTERDVQIELEA